LRDRAALAFIPRVSRRRRRSPEAPAMIVTESPGTGTICVNCGEPIDSKHFDESGFSAVPATGRKIILARFQFPPQYCGVLEYFAQYTDALGASPVNIETPTLEWLLLTNDRPLYPYVNFTRILNPWGYGSFQVNIRLDEGSTLEF